MLSGKHDDRLQMLFPAWIHLVSFVTPFTCAFVMKYANTLPPKVVAVILTAISWLFRNCICILLTLHWCAAFPFFAPIPESRSVGGNLVMHDNTYKFLTLPLDVTLDILFVIFKISFLFFSDDFVLKSCRDKWGIIPTLGHSANMKKQLFRAAKMRNFVAS